MDLPARVFVRPLDGMLSCTSRGTELTPTLHGTTGSYMAGQRRPASSNNIGELEVSAESELESKRRCDWSKAAVDWAAPWKLHSPIREAVMEPGLIGTEAVDCTKEESPIIRPVPTNGDSGDQQQGIRFSIDRDCDELSDYGTNGGKLTLWQFLLELLLSNKHTDIIRWTNKRGEFILLQAESVAKLWGMRKDRNHRMNYDKLSRALRYYYEKNIIRKVHGHKFVYQFIELRKLMKFCPSSACDNALALSKEQGNLWECSLPKCEEEILDVASNSSPRDRHSPDVENCSRLNHSNGTDVSLVRGLAQSRIDGNHISPIPNLTDSCAITSLQNTMNNLGNSASFTQPIDTSDLASRIASQPSDLTANYPNSFPRLSPFNPSAPLTADQLTRLTSMLRSFTSAGSFEHWYPPPSISNGMPIIPTKPPSAVDMNQSVSGIDQHNFHLFNSLAPQPVAPHAFPASMANGAFSSIPDTLTSPLSPYSMSYPSSYLNATPPPWMHLPPVSGSFLTNSGINLCRSDDHARVNYNNDLLQDLTVDKNRVVESIPSYKFPHQTIRASSPGCHCSCHRADTDKPAQTIDDRFKPATTSVSLATTTEPSISAVTKKTVNTMSESKQPPQQPQQRPTARPEKSSDLLNVSQTQLHHQRHAINMQRLGEQLTRMNRSTSVLTNRLAAIPSQTISGTDRAGSNTSLSETDYGDAMPLLSPDERTPLNDRLRSGSDSMGNSPNKVGDVVEGASPLRSEAPEASEDNCVWMPVPVTMLTSWLNLLATFRSPVDLNQPSDSQTAANSNHQSPSAMKRENLDDM